MIIYLPEPLPFEYRWTSSDNPYNPVDKTKYLKLLTESDKLALENSPKQLLKALSMLRKMFSMTRYLSENIHLLSLPEKVDGFEYKGVSLAYGLEIDLVVDRLISIEALFQVLLKDPKSKLNEYLSELM